MNKLSLLYLKVKLETLINFFFFFWVLLKFLGQRWDLPDKILTPRSWKHLQGLSLGLIVSI